MLSRAQSSRRQVGSDRDETSHGAAEVWDGRPHCLGTDQPGPSEEPAESPKRSPKARLKPRAEKPLSPAPQPTTRRPEHPLADRLCELIFGINQVLDQLVVLVRKSITLVRVCTLLAAAVVALLAVVTQRL